MDRQSRHRAARALCAVAGFGVGIITMALAVITDPRGFFLPYPVEPWRVVVTATVLAMALTIAGHLIWWGHPTDECAADDSEPPEMQKIPPPKP